MNYRQYVTYSRKLTVKKVRYTDTPAQRELKRITAARRQFRAAEYDIGVCGTADVDIHPSAYQRSPAPCIVVGAIPTSSVLQRHVQNTENR